LVDLPQDDFRGKEISFEQYCDLLVIGMAGLSDDLMFDGEAYLVDGMINYAIVDNRLGLYSENGWIDGFSRNMENSAEALISHDTAPSGQGPSDYWAYMNSGFDRIAELLHDKYYVKAVSENENDLSLPSQETAIQFGISDDGKLAVARRTGEADEARIESLLPALIRMLTAAEAELNQGNKAFGFLADTLAEYRIEVEKPAGQIEFGLVFALGSQIERALRLAKEKSADVEFADLPDASAIKIETLLDAHRPFMMSSKLGAELVVDNELFIETPKEQRTNSKNISELGEAFETIKEVTDEDTYEIIQNALKSGSELTTAKEKIFSRRVAKNLCIVVGGVSACAGPSIAAAAIGGPIIGGAGAVAGVVASLLISKPIDNAGKEINNVITPLMRQRFELIRKFALQHQAILSRSAKISGDATWFERLIGLQTIESSALLAIRNLEDLARQGQVKHVRLKVSSDVALYIFNEKRDSLKQIDDEYGLFTEVVGDEDVIRPSYIIEVLKKNTRKSRRRGRRGGRNKNKNKSDESTENDNAP